MRLHECAAYNIGTHYRSGMYAIELQQCFMCLRLSQVTYMLYIQFGQTGTILCTAIIVNLFELACGKTTDATS